MDRYTVNGSMTVTVSVTVDADSPEAAMAVAEGWTPDLCAHCSGTWTQIDLSRNRAGEIDNDNPPFSVDLDGEVQWEEGVPA